MTNRARLRRADGRAAFTLIELMIVVAILGILTAMAIPAFRGVMTRSKTAEAAANLNVMFKNVASYYSAERAEKGHTAGLFGACTVGDVGPLPAQPGAQKQRIPGNDPGFRAIGFYVADYAYYSYGLRTETGASTCGGTANDPTVYTLLANGDLDDDRLTSAFELAVGSDNSNQLYHARGIYVENELE